MKIEEVLQKNTSFAAQTLRLQILERSVENFNLRKQFFSSGFNSL